MTSSSKVIEPRNKKSVKAKPSQSVSNSQTQASSSQSSAKQTREARPRSKSKTPNRRNSKSPKASQKHREKPTVNLTRVQDEPIKVSNKYGNLEVMEEAPLLINKYKS